MNTAEQKRKVNVIIDENGKNIVLINDIRFKTRRSIDWDEVEEYLKEYIGKHYEILETSEKVYIGTDFPDEFCHSQDKIRLKGGNEKAKANMITAIGELIRVATNKAVAEDFGNKHKSKAQQGWYRYDTRFGIPVYNEEGILERYNVYSAGSLCEQRLWKAAAAATSALPPVRSGDKPSGAHWYNWDRPPALLPER